MLGGGVMPKYFRDLKKMLGGGVTPKYFIDLKNVGGGGMPTNFMDLKIVVGLCQNMLWT